MSESVSTTPVSSSSGANDFISDIIRADNEQGT